DTRLTHLQDGSPCRAQTAAGEVVADRMILATHAVPNRLQYHTRVHAYRTYAVAGTCSSMPPAGMYFDSEDPYHYIRTQDTSQGDLLIVGGYDHRTGEQEDTLAQRSKLRDYAAQYFKMTQIAYEWSGQILEPADGIPFIGTNGGDENTFFATGYAGNGITLGTVAGKLLSELAMGSDSPYAALFSSHRKDVRAQAGAVFKENLVVPKSLILDRLAAWATRDVEGLRPGEGKVCGHGAQAAAVFQQSDGKRHVLSAVCPHMGCIVHWNNGEKSWDCPCHGSRFSAEGKLLNGPALEDLKRVD
ncbi:MAG: FAD-dependent oxidoreductase, partial [Deltaproteobacteria bacterium]